MKSVPKEIQQHQIAHVTKADPAYGERIAKGVGFARNQNSIKQFQCIGAWYQPCPDAR